MRAVGWAAIGVACLFVGLPLSLAFRLGFLLLAAGSIFLVVAGVQWLWDRSRSRRGSGDADDDE